jgi:hypothetical protein
MHFETCRKASSSDDCEQITGYARLTQLRVAHELATDNIASSSKPADQFENAKMLSAARRVGRH